VIVRNSALAVSLSAAGYRVSTAEAGQERREWLDRVEAEDVAALVLQGEEVGWVAAAVAELRARGVESPVLALVADQAERDRLLAAAEGVPVTVLTLPLSYERLVAAVREALGRPAEQDVPAGTGRRRRVPSPEPAVEPVAEPVAAAEDGHSGFGTVSSGAKTGQEPAGRGMFLGGARSASSAESGQGSPRTSRLAQQLMVGTEDEAAAPPVRYDPAPGRPPVGAPAGHAAPVPQPDPPDPQPAPAGRPSERRRTRLRRGWFRSGGSGQPEPAAGRDAGPGAEEHRLVVTLVRRLLPVVEHVQGVRQVSEWVLESVLETVPAEAAALLLPDEGRWTVHAGMALRHLEQRQSLGPAHWLVNAVVEGRQGLIVEDTDIARIRLQDSPLASWRNLLIAPTGESGGVLLLARSGSGFAGPDLAAVVEMLEHVTPRLVEALEARQLARVLEPLIEQPAPS
jgi:CheY-like chemotaxis protein